jgi:hypothetical protein
VLRHQLGCPRRLRISPRAWNSRIPLREDADLREEATEMAMRQYRVKDFAAFYLWRITGLDLRRQPELADRDQAIARLRRGLATGP